MSTTVDNANLPVAWQRRFTQTLCPSKQPRYGVPKPTPIQNNLHIPPYTICPPHELPAPAVHP